MPHEVYVFGDSHWRVYFPVTNHGGPGVAYEQDGIVTLDTTANELSGATMYGLRTEDSRIGARRRILDTLRARDPVENVGLVFGEVDVRYHYQRYFRDDVLHMPSVMDLLAGYRRFIEDELLRSGLVTGRAFVYYGFRYAQNFVDSFGENWPKVKLLNQTLEEMISTNLVYGLPGRCVYPVHDPYNDRIVPITPRTLLTGPDGQLVSDRYLDDGVHMNGNIYNDFILPAMRMVLE